MANLSAAPLISTSVGSSTAGGIGTHHGSSGGVSASSAASSTSDSPLEEDRSSSNEATRWLSWYGVGLASADRLPVVVRIPAGPLGSLKCDPPKGNGR